jgi:NADH:ubiquinone oxidoreductase subunit 3 (subunit A)
MDRPHLVEAVWRTDFGILYPLVIVALALSVTLAVVLLVVRKKLRRETAMPGDETSEIEEMGEEKHCYECGRPLLPDARFCDQCGAEQMRKEKA